MNEIDIIRAGEPLEAMEAAKRIIGYPLIPDELIDQLTEIAEDRSALEWTRIATVYTLGFVDHEGRSAKIMEKILDSGDETANLRDYAKEALVYFGIEPDETN